MKRRTIRGVGGDVIRLNRAPDPLDRPLGLKPVDMLHIELVDSSGDSCITDGNGRNASVIGVFTMAKAAELHAALGQMLATTKRRRK